jgi:hypothetical protein
MREEPVSLSDFRSRTHPEFGPAVPARSIRCYLLDRLYSGLTCTNGCSCWSPPEEIWPRFVVVSDTRYHCATRPSITVCAGQLWCSEFRGVQCNAPWTTLGACSSRAAMSYENAGPCWMMTGRRGHTAGRTLRSGSGRSRPQRQAVRSPTPVLRRVPAGPRLLPTAHRRAGWRIPPETRPRRRGRAAPGPGLIAPCPTPGPVPARTGRGRCQAAPRVAARAAPAGPGRSLFGHAHHPPPRRPDRSSAQECGRAFGTC